MYCDTPKRKLESPSPWERGRKSASYTFDDINYFKNYASKRPKFHEYSENTFLDIYTKRAALKASSSVVSLVSYSGEEEIYQASGIVIESQDDTSIILTAANLIRCPTCSTSVAENLKVVVHLSDGKSFEGQIVAFDFHYNMIAVKILSDVPLPTACLAHIDDSMTVDASELDIPEAKSFKLIPHSTSFSLCPGDLVIALGRYFLEPYDFMAAPGEFSIDRCEYDCKELFVANCKITRCGIGGPIINRYGNVIGLSFYDMHFTPFMPINIASKWWEHHKKYGEYCRPWVGMEMTNLYVAELCKLERFMQKFPNIFCGVIVEEVTPGSSADSAGIHPNDVIVQCDGKKIQSFLQLFEVMWDKAGDEVKLIVLRESNGAVMHCDVLVDKASPNYSWSLWKYAP